jgi:hypothetical protein
MEPYHIFDPYFYDRLFAAAEAGRNADVMHRAAERRYQIAPKDMLSIQNYSAMLTMFDEQPETAASLTELCVENEPASPYTRINLAAALINNERFGSADLILRDINESAMSAPALNQLRFIKIKRADKLHLAAEARSLALKLDSSALYSQQIKWLKKHDFLP